MIENPLKLIKNLLLQCKKWYTCSYHGYKVKLDYNPRTGVCSVCNLKGFTNLHHTTYNFTRAEIRANSSLVTLFTYECCFNCHELSNSVRKLLFEDPSFTPKISNPKLQIIFKNHLSAFKKRDEFNRNRVKNLQKDWKPC
jgi:hypothetical protein